MLFESYIINFWKGKLKLWHSFWLIGGIGGIIIGQIIVFIEEKIFSATSQYPLDFTIRGKILILIWVIFTTIGIWRSTENYKGKYIWKILTKIYITINCLSSILLLFFFNSSEIYNF